MNTRASETTGRGEGGESPYFQLLFEHHLFFFFFNSSTGFEENTFNTLMVKVYIISVLQTLTLEGHERID